MYWWCNVKYIGCKLKVIKYVVFFLWLRKLVLFCVRGVNFWVFMCIIYFFFVVLFREKMSIIGLNIICYVDIWIDL